MSQESIARRESASPQALDAMIGYQLKHLQSALRSHMDEALRPIGLSTPQYACLELLRREPGASNSELARGAFVTRQTMSTLLRGLQDRGFVTRPAKASTGRALPTTLTPDGEDALDQAMLRVEPISALMVSSLDETQKNNLGESLDLCIQALDAPAP
ncbi:MAG: MarR family transcriptional regulator [Brevibacterium sp.]|uniref:MarR family winged helix-turn-helix transcriptional regulator n=1 Tax=Brevibacterium sp. TaxID=1701 RepID=UPI002649180F|nr:MarR family transcriptional regulator [Brevibacterium sp.]MDN5807012.1 MarR family transcriptional regulator [Brevibacterium sp.]MDN5833420.1 MarR family transcriptional regulator [Brevibacterium sp.]MDN5875913.1 MarR family transcriptional regulator [Brevibacterium sp.]MDN5909943.1 MarR family transcriptional regulator [Brevibacterium sp.]MDN6133344.1 MarR family transcriptional regulator [Brevibacterium sp.]